MYADDVPRGLLDLLPLMERLRLVKRRNRKDVDYLRAEVISSDTRHTLRHAGGVGAPITGSHNEHGEHGKHADHGAQQLPPTHEDSDENTVVVVSDGVASANATAKTGAGGRADGQHPSPLPRRLGWKPRVVPGKQAVRAVGVSSVTKPAIPANRSPSSNTDEEHWRSAQGLQSVQVISNPLYSKH